MNETKLKILLSKSKILLFSKILGSVLFALSIWILLLYQLLEYFVTIFCTGSQNIITCRKNNATAVYYVLCQHTMFCVKLMYVLSSASDNSYKNRHKLDLCPTVSKKRKWWTACHIVFMRFKYQILESDIASLSRTHVPRANAIFWKVFYEDVKKDSMLIL